jgi:hypothetical protein
MLTRPAAAFELARRLQIGDATLGEVFAFCSGLYFRGKLAYANRFAQPPPKMEGAQVITPSRGLVPANAFVGLAEMTEFGGVPVDVLEPRFARPLAEAARALMAGPDCEVVLLGSVATGKYVDVLLPILGERLLFPEEFIGRGDMSRGGLMLRCVSHAHELRYIPVAGAIRKGRRAARVETMGFGIKAQPNL